MVKLILSDMDNTLIPIGHDRVSARTLRAIDAARAAGLHFAPATGRGPVELAPFFLNDESYYATGILYNGQKVYVDGHLIYEKLYAFDDLQRLERMALSLPDTVMYYYPDNPDASNPAWAVGADDATAQAHGKRYRFTPHVVAHAPEVPYISAVVATGGGDAAVDAIRERMDREGLPLELVQTFPGWCDVLPKGVSKASGLTVLSDALGVTDEEIIVFGDAENDLALFSAVTNSVAVANATPAARRAARWHIGACADDAVAAAMEELVHQARTGQFPSFMSLG